MPAWLYVINDVTWKNTATLSAEDQFLIKKTSRIEKSWTFDEMIVDVL